MLDILTSPKRSDEHRAPVRRVAGYVADVALLAVGALALSAWLNLCYPIPVKAITHLRAFRERKRNS